MCDIGGIQYCCCVIRINVADELCLHFEGAVLLRPVLQCKIHRTRSEVASADTDLNNRCELFSGSVCNLSGMNLLCKISNLVLLFHIKSSLVYAVGSNGISQLSTGQLMENKTLLSCVDHFSVVQRCVFFRKLCFVCKCSKLGNDILIHFLGCIVIYKSGSHRYAVVLYTIRSVVPRHYLCKIYLLRVLCEILIRFQGIKIIPCYHSYILHIKIG